MVDFGELPLWNARIAEYPTPNKKLGGVGIICWPIVGSNSSEMIFFQFIYVLHLFVCAELTHVRASSFISTIGVDPSALIPRFNDHWTPPTGLLSPFLPKRASYRRSYPKKLSCAFSSLNDNPPDLNSFYLSRKSSCKGSLGISCPSFSPAFQRCITELRKNHIGVEIDEKQKLALFVQDNVFERDEALNALLSLSTHGFQSSIRMITFFWRGSKLDESWLDALTFCEIQHVVLELSPSTTLKPVTMVARDFSIFSRPHTIRLTSSISQTLWDNFMSTLPSSMPSIKIIEVDNANLPSLNTLAPLVKCANNLEVLKIDARLDDIFSFIDLFANLVQPTLHTLSISVAVPRATSLMTKNLNDLIVTDLITRIPNLKHLILNPMLTFHSAAISTMLEQMKSLETFEVFLDEESVIEDEESAIWINPLRHQRHFPNGNGREVFRHFFNAIQRTHETARRKPIKFIIHHWGEKFTYVPTSFPTEN